MVGKDEVILGEWRGSLNEKAIATLAQEQRNVSHSVKRPVVFVDVDDTLVRSAGSKRIPIPLMIQHVHKLHQAGFELYLWSSGGAEYCRASAAELGITECFVVFQPKPNIMIDDQPPHN